MKSSILILLLSIPLIGLAQIATDENVSDRKLNKLVLRQIAGYCNHLTDDYTCLPYEWSALSKDSVQQFINKHYASIEELVIENPSRILFDLRYNQLNSLKRLELFGNDYNTDGIRSIPTELLELPSLEVIQFYGVRYPIKALEDLRQKYEHINIIGEIADY